MIPRIDRLVLNEIVGPFIGSVALFTGLFFAGGELVRFAEFLQKGENWWLIGQLIAFSLPFIVSLTFPMGMLLATLLGFGRLSGDSEIVALLAGGASLERILAPVVAFGVFVSLLGFWFNQTIVPNANRARQTIIDNVKNNADLSSANAFTLPLRDGEGNLTLVYVKSGVDIATGTLRDVTITEWKKGEAVPSTFIAAPTAQWKTGTKDWTLRNFTAAYLTGKSRMVLSAQEGQTWEQTLDTPTALAAQARPVIEVTTASLQERSRLLRQGHDEGGARAADVELARRVQLPFASLAFALVGAPLGVRPQRGGKGVGFGLSVLITFLYWMSIQVVSVMGRGGMLPPMVALALPNLVCLMVGFFLIRRTMR